MLDLSPLKAHISDRAYALLEVSGLELETLHRMTADEIADAVRGVGPVMADEIVDGLLLIDTEPTTIEAPAVPDENAMAAMRQALVLLTSQGRRADVANLNIRLTKEPVDEVLGTAIAILEGLTPGRQLGLNMANQVRAILQGATPN